MIGGVQACDGHEGKCMLVEYLPLGDDDSSVDCASSCPLFLFPSWVYAFSSAVVNRPTAQICDLVVVFLNMLVLSCSCLASWDILICRQQDIYGVCSRAFVVYRAICGRDEESRLLSIHIRVSFSLPSPRKEGKWS
jgi:hypothetical protein